MQDYADKQDNDINVQGNYDNMHFNLSTHMIIVFTSKIFLTCNLSKLPQMQDNVNMQLIFCQQTR